MGHIQGGSIIPKPEGEENADDSYSEVVEQLKRALRQGDFRAGELLAQVIEEELYGKWPTFRDFVAGKLRISERTAYRMIASFKMCVVLKEHGCKLPVNERQVRPLSALKPPLEPMRVTAWKTGL